MLFNFQYCGNFLFPEINRTKHEITKRVKAKSEFHEAEANKNNNNKEIFCTKSEKSIKSQ